MEMNRAELAAVDGVACDLLDARGRLVITPNALTCDGQRNAPVDLQPGETLEAFLRRHVPGISSGAWTVMIGGATVPRSMWVRTWPKHGQLISCRASVGKQAVALVAMAALAYFSMGMATGIYGAMGGTFVSAAAGAYIGAIQVGVLMAGSMLINKVLGPKVPKIGEAAAARQVYSLTSQRNSARPYEPLPVLWGEMRVTPDLAGQPYTWFDGDNQYLSTVLLGGINVHSAADLSVGDTPLSSFEEVSVFHNGFSGMASEEIPLYGNVDAIAGADLENDGAWVTRTTSTDTVVVQVDVEGQLYDIDNKGNTLVNSVPLFIETRPAGAADWQPAHSVTLSNATLDVVRRTYTVSVAQGQHEVRVRLGKPTYDEGSGKDACKFVWTALKSIQPDTADYSGLGRVGIKIKATGQLSGSLDTVRATYRARPLPVWNGTEWITATTRAEGLSNCGAILLQTLRGVYANGVLQFGFGMSDEQIDIEGLKAFMLHCTARGYTYDRWVTSSMSLGQFCEEVALAGMGEFSWTDGSRPTAVFVSSGQPLSGVVNMANMLKGSFSVAYNLANAADGIEYEYLDRDRNWETQTLRVAAPGVTTMLNPARITGEGVTTEAHAAVLARYHLAQSLYQYKTIDFGADIEHLAYRRLSVLSISHDLTQWGFGGRVMAAGVNAAGKVVLQLDEPVPPMAQAYVGLRVPGARDYRVFKVEALEAESEWIALVEPWPESVAFPGEPRDGEDNPAWDTLWCYDFKATPGYRVRVVGMQPEADLKGAQVTCVPEGPEFWDYVLNGTYTPAPNQSSLPQLARPKVSNLRITEKVNVQSDTEWYSLSLVWDVEGDYDHAQVWAGRDGSELRLVDGNAVGSRSEFRIDGAGEWLVEVRPFNASGLVGQSATVLYITTQTQLPPRNVDDFVVQSLAGGLRRFAWQYTGARPPAFAGVQIRYVPGDVPLSVAEWDRMQPLGDADDIYSAQFETTRPQAGLWTFGCRAIDTAGQLANGVVRFVANLEDSFEQVQQPDLTPPPDVTGLKVTGFFTSVMAEWDAPVYSEGHGHARTIIYAAPGADAALADAVPMAESFAGPASFASPANAVWTVWARNQSVDGELSVNAVGGLTVRTSEDVDGVMDAIEGRVSEDHLVQHLGERLDLVDGSGPGSVNARLAQQAQTTLDAIAAEADVQAQALLEEAGKLRTSISEVKEELQEADSSLARSVDTLTASLYSRPNLCQEVDQWTDGGGAFFVSNGSTWGTYRAISNPSGTVFSDSPRMPVDPDTAYVVTGDTIMLLADGGSGFVYLQFLFYDANGGMVLDPPERHPIAVGHSFSDDNTSRNIHAIEVVSPVNAASVVARFVGTSLTNCTLAGFRQVKVERGTLPATPYSQEGAFQNTTAAIKNEQEVRADEIAAQARERELLAVQLRGNHTGTDLDGLTEGLLAQQRNTSASQYAALAEQMAMLSAGAGEQFDYAKIWYYDSGTEGWTGNGTPSEANGFLRPANANDPNVISPAGLDIETSKYRQVRMRVRRVGSPVWEGRLYWKATVDSGFSEGNAITLDEPTYDANGIGLVTANPPWGGTLDRIRLDLSPVQTSSDYFEIDWVAIGRPSPGASSAALLEEQLTRAAKDLAESTARQTLSTKLTGLADPSGATLEGLSSGLVFEEKTARNTAVAAVAKSVETLTATVGGNKTATDAAIRVQAEAVAEVERAAATRMDALSARLQSRSNLVRNGSFENGFDSWIGETAKLAVSDTVWGPMALGTVSGNGIIASRLFAVEAAAIYTVAGDSHFLHSATGAVVIDIEWLAADFSILGSSGGGSVSAPHNFTADDSGRNAHAHQAQAPAGASLARARFWWANVTNGLIGCRQVKVERGVMPASPYSQESSVSDNYALVQAETAARVTEQAAQASATQALQAKVGGGGNWCDNSEFVANLDGWNFEAVGAGAADYHLGRNLSQQWIVGDGTAYIEEDGQRAPGGYGEASPAQFPVEPGKRYQFSVYTGAHRCAVHAFMFWVGADGVAIGNSPFDTNDEAASGGEALGGYKRLTSFGVAPAGAVRASARVRKGGTKAGQVNSYAFFTRAYFGEATAEQTQPTPYAPGGNGRALAAAQQVEQSVRAEQTGMLFSRYSVKIDLNGYMTGYGLLSESNSGVNTSTFAVRADRFVIGSASNNEVTPFYVEGNTTFMNMVVIRDGSIKNVMIQDASIESAKIVSLSVAKLVTGSLAVGQSMYSSGYSPGFSGWVIDGNGTSEFNQITVRGTIYASAGAIAGLTLRNNAITAGAFTGSSWPANGGTGFVISPGGILMGNYSTGKWFEVQADGSVISMPGLRIADGNATFSGALSAATGSFAGALSAATGTFAGTLSGVNGSFAGQLYSATGTFSGSLTAQAINAVDTVNIAGEAVTVPVAVNGSSATINLTSAASVSVLILCHPNLTGDNSATIVIRRNGAVIHNLNAGPSTAPGNGTIAFIDGPVSGTITYSYQASWVGGGGGFIQLLGIKR